jgi:hypothetical protein
MSMFQFHIPLHSIGLVLCLLLLALGSLWLARWVHSFVVSAWRYIVNVRIRNTAQAHSTPLPSPGNWREGKARQKQGRVNWVVVVVVAAAAESYVGLVCIHRHARYQSWSAPGPSRVDAATKGAIAATSIQTPYNNQKTNCSRSSLGHVEWRHNTWASNVKKVASDALDEVIRVSMQHVSEREQSSRWREVQHTTTFQVNLTRCGLPQILVY